MNHTKLKLIFMRLLPGGVLLRTNFFATDSLLLAYFKKYGCVVVY